MIGEDLADALDLLVEGAAGDAETLGGLLDRQALLAEQLTQPPLGVGEFAQCPSEIDAGVLGVDGVVVLAVLAGGCASSRSTRLGVSSASPTGCIEGLGIEVTAPFRPRAGPTRSTSLWRTTLFM